MNSKCSLTVRLVIDESSMISDQYSDSELFMFGSGFLLTDIFQYTEGRKIVFVGDYAQLPPVGMNFSPALDKNYLTEKFKCHICIHQKVQESYLQSFLRMSIFPNHSHLKYRVFLLASNPLSQ